MKNTKQLLTRLLKSKSFWYLVMLPVVINALVWVTVFGGHWYYEKEVERIYQEGWEVGYFEGQLDGYDAGVESVTDDFYNKLSKNPQVSFLFKKYFPEKDIATTMRAISLSESKGKQVQHYKLNKNGSWDCGFFQTNTIHRNKGEPMESFCDRMNSNLEANFAMARKIYDDRKKMFGNGFTAWSDYNNGKYLNYIK